MSTDQSLEKSLRNVVHYSTEAITKTFLSPTIQQRFHQFKSAGIPLVVKVNAADSKPLNDALLHYLNNLPQVAGASQNGWDKDERYLELDVQFRGDSHELATLVDGLSIYETSLTVTAINPDDLECELTQTESSREN